MEVKIELELDQEEIRLALEKYIQKQGYTVDRIELYDTALNSVDPDTNTGGCGALIARVAVHCEKES